MWEWLIDKYFDNCSTTRFLGADLYIFISIQRYNLKKKKKTEPNTNTLVNYQLFIIDLFPKLFFRFFSFYKVMIGQSLVSVNNLIERKAQLIRQIPEMLLIVQEERSVP